MFQALGYLCEGLAEDATPQSVSLVNQLLSAVFHPFNEVLRVSSLPIISKIHSLFRASLSPDLEGQIASLLLHPSAALSVKANSNNNSSGSSRSTSSTTTTSAVSHKTLPSSSSDPSGINSSSRLNDLYKLFLKGDSFLPDYVEVFTETKVIFRNEDKCTHLIECRGNLLFSDLLIASRGEKSFVFAKPGRYELSGQNKSAMKVSE